MISNWVSEMYLIGPSFNINVGNENNFVCNPLSECIHTTAKKYSLIL